MIELERNIIDIKELAERWKLSKSALNVYLRDGIISKIEGIPSVRFNLDYIKSIENQLDERRTWREIQLEEEIKALQIENQRLKTLIGETIGNLSSGLK